MNPLLKKLKDVKAECCVTLIINTHRTAPDNKKDPITLKNAVKIAEDRIETEFDKKFSKDLILRMNELADSIDHNENLESLVLFINEHMAEYTRLAVPVESRVVLDETFATRDLVRADHEQAHYYILVISKNEARLLEAMNDKDLAEIKGDFPMNNGNLYNTDNQKKTDGKSNDNLAEEFFNRIDKAVQKAIAGKPRPIVIVAEDRNHQHFMSIADKKEQYVLHSNKTRGEETAKPHHIVSDVWPLVHQWVKDKQAARIQELQTAVSSGKFRSDFNEIWAAIHEGKGETLFVKRGYYQPAKLQDNTIELVDAAQRNDIGIVDDIIDEIIEANLRFGGDTVFIENEDLDKFQGLALTTRY
jgi:hypothetical protein